MKKLTISFDVDGTLLKWKYYDKIQRWAVGHEPHTRVIKFLKKFHSLGHNVIIVTTRQDSDDAGMYKTYLETQGEEFRCYPFISVKQLIEEQRIPVAFENINFTNGKLKASTLKRLGVDKHYDDNIMEIEECMCYGIKAKLIRDNDEPYDL